MEKANLTNLMKKLGQRARHCYPPFLSLKTYPVVGPLLFQSLRTLWSRKEQATAISAVTISAIYLWKKWKAVLIGEKAKRSSSKSLQRGKGLADGTRTSIAMVDSTFLRRLWRLLKILYPSLHSNESLVTSLLTLLLLARTLLSLKIAEAMGYNAKCLVQRKLDRFIFGVIALGIVAIPTVIVNSGVAYFTQMLSLLYRRRLSRHVHKMYLSDLAFYKANFGGNIDNIDQRVAQDIERFSSYLANLYGNVFKPVTDLALFTSKLSAVIGYRGPLLMYIYYIISGLFLRWIMPPFPKLTAHQQRLEGDFRLRHSRLIGNSEEVAFLRGSSRERQIINAAFDRVYAHAGNIFRKQAVVSIVDELLVKYGATMVGYSVVAFPVFGGTYNTRLSGWSQMGELPFREVDSLQSEIAASVTGDYVRNTQILINLARAIGRLVMLHKEINLLAGYTGRVWDLLALLETLQDKGAAAPRKPTIPRLIEGGGRGGGGEEEDEGSTALRGEYEESDHTKLEDVSIVTPDGLVLVEGLTFDLPYGKNLLIYGPNGSGKSSLFRVLCGLWPLERGRITRLPAEEILYIPQQPYLSYGSLRDQVIYPHSPLDFEAKGTSTEQLENIMHSLNLYYLVQREGWDKVSDWNEALSGGEKQRLVLARLLYHNPRLAVMDECTSAVSSEVESFIYHEMKQRGISCITVSHRRRVLWRFHDYLLQLHGDGTWDWQQIDQKKEEAFKNNYTY